MQDPRAQITLPIQDNNLEEKSLSELVTFIVAHPKYALILKAVINRSITLRCQEMEDTINEAVTYHKDTDEELSELLNIKLREE